MPHESLLNASRFAVCRARKTHFLFKAEKDEPTSEMADSLLGPLQCTWRVDQWHCCTRETDNFH